MTQYFNSRNVGIFDEAQEQGVHSFLNELLDSPCDYRDITQRSDINMHYVMTSFATDGRNLTIFILV